MDLTAKYLHMNNEELFDHIQEASGLDYHVAMAEMYARGFADFDTFAADMTPQYFGAFETLQAYLDASALRGAPSVKSDGVGTFWQDNWDAGKGFKARIMYLPRQ